MSRTHVGDLMRQGYQAVATTFWTAARWPMIQSGRARPPGFFLAALLPAPVVLREDPLAQANGDRSDLDQLVGRDELDRGLQRERPRRGQPQRPVLSVRAYVGELLLLADVHVHVAGSAVSPAAL